MWFVIACVIVTQSARFVWKRASQFGRMREGRSELNYAVYHDRYERTPDGWKFSERVYEVIYLDTAPLAGTATRAAQPGIERRP